MLVRSSLAAELLFTLVLLAIVVAASGQVFGQADRAPSPYRPPVLAAATPATPSRDAP